jgi:alkylation response protein AidB-like acyl-CoA dehydrogenase
MLFEFDADQRMWQDVVRDIVTKECPPSLIRGVVDGESDPQPLWRTYVKLGWTELTDPAQMIELAIVLEELGRALDPTPYLATLSQFAPMVADFDHSQTGATVYNGVKAQVDGDTWRLVGTARHVLDGDRADRLAVVTTAGVFVVEASRATVVRSPVFDPGLHVAEVRFDGVPVTRADLSHSDPERARHVALTGLALTVVGACRRVLDLTLEHVRTRTQFGALIGTFQAVQHKAADMHVAIERARALAYFAALTIAEDDPRRRLAAAMAKAAAGECQSLVFRHGLQLFGGMGFTWENDLQLALKRAKAGELMLGGASEHRALIADEYRSMTAKESR